MKSFIAELKEYYPVSGGKLECILVERPFDDTPDTWKRPAVVIAPGGGYRVVCRHETDTIATEFLARGFQVFILTYLSYSEGYGYPEQLFEIASAVDYIKKNASAFRVNPDEVFAVGFSAGGHLVGTLAVEQTSIPTKMGKDIDCRVAAVGLCYPVIRNDLGHIDSHERILEKYSDEEKVGLLKTLNLDEGVTDETPPAFIWSTATDSAVSSLNALAYATALAKRKIAYELHVYPQGEHGLTACSREMSGDSVSILQKARRWLDDCATFFRLFCKEEF